MNPTAIEITGTLLLWCWLAALHHRDRPPGLAQLLTATSIAGFVVLVRPVAVPWIAVAFASFWFLDRRPVAPDRRSTVRLLTIAATPLVVALVASAAWSHYAGVGLTDDKYVDHSSVFEVFQAGLGRTGLLYEQLLGILGWLDTRIPFPAYVAATVSLAAGVTVVWLHAARRARWLLVGLLGVWILYPTLYVTVARTPLVWQGRYNLPLLGALTLTVVSLRRPAGSRDPIRAATIADRLATTFVVCFGIAEVLAFHQALRRFMVGSSGDLWLRDPSWYPAVSAWGLIAINATTVAALGRLLLRGPRTVTG